MDQAAERPQNQEIEKVPLLRIGFLGSDASFVGIQLQKQMGQDKTFFYYALNYPYLKSQINQWRELGQDIPRIVITDKISPKQAEELNSQGISIIFLNQGHGDSSYLTSDNPQRKVRNAVILAESIDEKHVGTVLSDVVKAINELIQPK